MNSLRLILPGIPRTKKTSNRVFHIGQKCRACNRGSRAVVQPSEAWTTWCDSLVRQVAPVLPITWHPIDFPVNCLALFYRDAERGDAVGFYQGLADALEHIGIVANDKWIRSWDDSLLLKDAGNPRVELVLTRKDVTP